MICEITKSSNPEDLQRKINELLKDEYNLISVTVNNGLNADSAVEYVAWLVKDDKFKNLLKKAHKSEIEKLNLLKINQNNL